MCNIDAVNPQTEESDFFSLSHFPSFQSISNKFPNPVPFPRLNSLPLFSLVLFFQSVFLASYAFPRPLTFIHPLFLTHTLLALFPHPSLIPFDSNNSITVSRPSLLPTATEDQPALSIAQYAQQEHQPASTTTTQIWRLGQQRTA